MSYVAALHFVRNENYVHNYYGPYAYCSLDKGVAYTRGGGGIAQEPSFGCPFVYSRHSAAEVVAAAMTPSQIFKCQGNFHGNSTTTTGAVTAATAPTAATAAAVVTAATAPTTVTTATDANGRPAAATTAATP